MRLYLLVMTVCSCSPVWTSWLTLSTVPVSPVALLWWWSPTQPWAFAPPVVMLFAHCAKWAIMVYPTVKSMQVMSEMSAWLKVHHIWCLFLKGNEYILTVLSPSVMQMNCETSETSTCRPQLTFKSLWSNALENGSSKKQWRSPSAVTGWRTTAKVAHAVEQISRCGSPWW